VRKEARLRQRDLTGEEGDRGTRGALEALEEQLAETGGDLDVLVEGFHARIDAILSRMDEVADKVASPAETAGGAGRPCFTALES